jgi:hypothetical protein
MVCCRVRRYNADLERVVRARVRRGRHFPIMKVIPPGLDFSNLKISPPPDPLEAANPGRGQGQLAGQLAQPCASFCKRVPPRRVGMAEGVLGER